MSTEQPPLTGRHPSVQNLMRWLTPNPNLPEPQLHVVSEIVDLAYLLLRWCPDGPELVEGLRKLLEAKDCFVRASFGPETSS